MGRVARRSGLLVLLAWSAAAAADDPRPLQPVGRWTVHDADSRCLLERDYGAADRPTVLSLTPGTLGTAVGLRVVESRSFQDRIVERDAGSVTVQSPAGSSQPGSRTIPVAVRSYGPVAGDKRLTSAQLRDLSVYDVVLSPTLVIARGRAGPPIAIAPGGSPEAVQALDRCEDGLLRRLGIARAQALPLSRQPMPVDGSTARWFLPTDYPRSTMGSMPFGHVVARAIVGADGTVGQCVVAEGSGDRDLDAKTCDILRTRGRYLPALDEAGRPVAAPVVVPVNWEPPARR